MLWLITQRLKGFVTEKALLLNSTHCRRTLDKDPIRVKQQSGNRLFDTFIDREKYLETNAIWYFGDDTKWVYSPLDV